MSLSAKDKLIVALDVETFEEARKLIDALSPHVDIFKVGSQMFTASGPVAVRYLLAHGKKVFLDLKYHDIPNTVANAVQSAVELSKEVHQVVDEKQQPINNNSRSICMLTVHTLGGEEMMKIAAERAAKISQTLGVKKPLILGITVLTSTDKTDNIQQLVLERAKLAKNSGLDGVVASSQETEFLRRELGKDFVIVTPGIRPAGAEQGDQKRVSTPGGAVKGGSDYLVVGRPIVKAKDPVQAAQQILQEIQQAL